MSLQTSLNLSLYGNIENNRFIETIKWSNINNGPFTMDPFNGYTFNAPVTFKIPATSGTSHFGDIYHIVCANGSLTTIISVTDTSKQQILFNNGLGTGHTISSSDPFASITILCTFSDNSGNQNFNVLNTNNATFILT